MPLRNLISKRKSIYPLQSHLREYLEAYGRIVNSGVRYEDLHRYKESTPLYDERGKDTLWSTVLYPPSEMREIFDQLLLHYAHLEAAGDLSGMRHLSVDRVDVCLYANTQPFRIRIINDLNDNFDYYYVKKADANRVYGLELEHILSPNRIHFVIHENTLIEGHIVGVPGDVFVRDLLPDNRFDLVRLAKEFVKFNERCFRILLGDMHSGNFVIHASRDFDKWQYRIRPIDFDQQSHHWRKQVYMPQLYTQNNKLVFIGMQCMTPVTASQYQREERAQITGRMEVSSLRFERLMDVMREDIIAPDAYVDKLAHQLAAHYRVDICNSCSTMGDLVYHSLMSMVEADR